MKKRYFFIILFFLIILLLYVTNISQIPDKIVLLNGEQINSKKLYGIEFKEKQSKIIETWQSGNVENKKMNVSLFGRIDVKEVSVISVPKMTVVPVGNLIGLKLYTNGVLVIGMTELKNKDNQMEKSYENINIKEGDTILELNNQEIDSIKTLQTVVNNSSGKSLEIKYAHMRRDNDLKYKTNRNK